MQERLYQNKINGSLVSNFNCKMAYYVTFLMRILSTMDKA